MTALSQLGIAGAIVGGAIFLLRELKKLSGAEEALDRLWLSMKEIDKRLDRIEQAIAYRTGREDGVVEAERSGRWQVPPPPQLPPKKP